MRISAVMLASVMVRDTVPKFSYILSHGVTWLSLCGYFCVMDVDA